ncbi:WD40 repeat-like protein [Auriculariales sp. MPI-PUGE-AT-0066]|nr:WD40 repeat-like protein [Auriculariales sp. MPI-PUGE-AT-0066]
MSRPTTPTRSTQPESESSLGKQKRQRTDSGSTNERPRPKTPVRDRDHDSATSSTLAASPYGLSPPPKRQRRDVGDRFVPDRSDDLRTAYHLRDDAFATGFRSKMIPSESDAQKEQSNQIFQTILQNELAMPISRPASPTRGTPSAPGTPTRNRVLNFGSPTRPGRGTPRMDDDQFQTSPVRKGTREFLESPRRAPRSVCKTPFRVLDAPDLADDFYLSELSWSGTNVLAVGLGACVYLWNAATADVNKLCDYGSTDVVSSVAWAQAGSNIAIGTYSGNVHLWDPANMRQLRTFGSHGNRVGTLAWYGSTLASGSRDRAITLADVRAPAGSGTRALNGHRQEVCGLSWSGEGLLASGGNDNKVLVWDIRGAARGGDPNGELQPLYKYHEHTAAVKALAWNPHMMHCLATGGGTQDKFIRFWNTATGDTASERHLDTGSQVCALLWSKTTHEVVSSHGFSATAAQNQILIFKYPQLSMVASLTGHTSRVLYLAMSPDGETIVSGAGDETLRFWTAFPKKNEAVTRPSRRGSPMDVGARIR